MSRDAGEVFVALPWINVHAANENEGAQRVALLESLVNGIPWADYSSDELLRHRFEAGDHEEWSPPDTSVEAASERFAPYLGKTWLRQARAYGPAPRPFFIVRSYEPNPEALR